jgi:hypothetical protein
MSSKDMLSVGIGEDHLVLRLPDSIRPIFERHVKDGTLDVEVTANGAWLVLTCVCVVCELFSHCGERAQTRTVT